MSYGRVLAATMYLKSVDMPESEIPTATLERFFLEVEPLANQYRLTIDHAEINSLVEILPGE